MLDPSQLRAAVRHEGGVSRRLFLAYASALAALPLLAGRSAAAPATRPVAFPTDPFALGVASGDPDHAGVVLWTRLAPAPLEADGGMRAEPVAVRWELAEDDGMRRVVRSGTAVATPALAHAVHAEVDGLAPDRWYWYRFHAGDATSPVGRTRTMPEPTAAPAELRFAFASCQHYEAGLYTAYEAMAKDELDLVLHLGDYIYEGPGRATSTRPASTHSPASSRRWRPVPRYATPSTGPTRCLHGMHAPAVPVGGDVGRPRVREQLRQRHFGQTKGVDPAAFLVQPGGRLPGVLRGHAAAGQNVGAERPEFEAVPVTVPFGHAGRRSRCWTPASTGPTSRTGTAASTTSTTRP